MMKNVNYVALVLREPNKVLNFEIEQFTLLARQARKANLLASIGEKLSSNELLDKIPTEVRHHFDASIVHSRRHKPGIKLEVRHLRKVLSDLNLELVLLKGAAYVHANLPAAKGRFFNDVDILVPKKKIALVEQALRDDGWVSSKTDAYDNRYYRDWMHEIPPLRHFLRKTELDVHHTILPPTSKFKPDAKKILADIRELEPGVYTLSPADMVIHSATHLFHEGEFDHGLRDIFDLHGLLTHFGKNEPDFWGKLVPRAIELDLINPLYYALHYCSLILETDIPQDVLQQAVKGKPDPVMSRVMDWLFMRALRPDHPSCDLPFTSLARSLLYIRSHYLRMPLRLLLPHLMRKTWKKRFEKNDIPTVPEKQL